MSFTHLCNGDQLTGEKLQLIKTEQCLGDFCSPLNSHQTNVVQMFALVRFHRRLSSCTACLKIDRLQANCERYFTQIYWIMSAFSQVRRFFPHVFSVELW